MLKAIFISLCAVLLAAGAPWVLQSKPPEPRPEELLLLVEQAKPEESTVQKTSRQVRLEDRTLPLEEYLTGVVLAEMPMEFELEAIKAQAIAARTFTCAQIRAGKHRDYDVCSDSSCCQAWMSREAARERLGSSWKDAWNRAAEAVAATGDLVMTYEGTLADAVYFSCSGGQTEEAAAVWGSEVPYLQSVPSPGEEHAGVFHSTVEVPIGDFRAKLLEQDPEASLQGNPEQWFGAVSRTTGGGVETVEIGGRPFTGTQLRSMFGLKSARFTIAVCKTGIRFEVEGYGHRVGMSQYGADAMAAKGSTCEEILRHYYRGIALEPLTDRLLQP